MTAIPLRLPLSVLLALLLSACASTVRQAPEEPAESVVDLPRVALEPDILYDILLGEIAGQRGHIETAAVTLGKVAQKTRDPRLAERATLAALYAKRYADAMRSAQLWVELRPANLEAREALAMALLELNQPAQAQLHLEKILALEKARKNLDRAYIRIANVLGRQSNRSAALEIMETLVRLYPKRAAAHFAVAHLAVRVGELDKANAAVDDALALKPDWEDAALFKARVLVSKKDVPATQSFYENFLDDYPSSTNVRINYARYLVDQKQWEKARNQFKRVVKERPEDADAVYAVGLLSMQINKMAEAEQYMERALQLRPQNDQARLYLGQIAEQGKEYDKAARWYREVGAGEHNFEAQARLGVIIAKQGDIEAARKHINGIQAKNDKQRVQLALSEEQILRDAKQYQEAKKVLDTAIKNIPEDKDLLYARALIAEKLDLLDLAESDLRAILKKDPDNVHALNALGYTLADRTDRYEEAEELLTRALALKPDDPFILDSMGWLQYRLGNHAEAVKYLRRALSIRNDAEISAHLGEVLWVMGDHSEAKSVWTRALRETPDNEVLIDIINKFKP